MITKQRLNGDGGVRLVIKFTPGAKRNGNQLSNISVFRNGILKAKAVNVNMEDLLGLEAANRKYIEAYTNNEE